MIRSLIDEWRGGFAGLAPGRFPYAGFLAALLVGTAGALLFVWLRLPLPWMLGSMTACTLGALMRAPIAAPALVRPPMTMVIGVMLGAGFSPAVLAQVPGWAPTMLGLVGFILVCGLACVAYFRRVARFDPVTAYFAGMPGGLVEMVVVGDERGGDARTIALVHSARILLVVLTLPFLVSAVGGVSLGARPAGGPSLLDTPLVNEAWLLLTALAGAVLGHALRLPAKYLLGPMIASAIVHGVGLTDFTPPVEVVNAAQLVLGTTIGCRFLGTPPREILRILGLSVGSTLILLAVTLAFAVGVSRVSTYGVVPLLLAYSPGGLAEMSLVALALQIEVAFVAAHHVVRVFLVMIGAGPVFGLVRLGGP